MSGLPDPTYPLQSTRKMKFICNWHQFFQKSREKAKKEKARPPRSLSQNPRSANHNTKPKAERFVYTSVRQMARESGISEAQAHKSLEEMKSLGLIETKTDEDGNIIGYRMI